MAKCELDPDCALENEHETPCANERHEYTPRERELMLERMRFAVDTFYSYAQLTNVHQFLEFAGLMSEYVKQCRKLHERGIDFATEQGKLFELCDEQHAALYLGEKVNCIYGADLRKPGNLAAFLAGLGVEMHPTPLEGVQP